MNEEQNNLNQKQIRNIHDRIYDFIIRVIKFTRFLPKTSQNIILIHQIVKSVTSMGANDQEANAAESRKDFLAKYTIVKKETRETNYWLNVILDTNESIIQIQGEVKALIQEGIEILKIITSIIIKTKNKP